MKSGKKSWGDKVYVIYVDLLFLINFLMDGCIFITASQLLGQRVGWKRIFCASILGATIYCMLVICPLLQQLPYGLFALFVPVFPILYLYKSCSLGGFIREYIVSTGVAFLIGGTTYALWYIVGGYRIGQQMTITYIIVAGGGVTILVNSMYVYVRKRFVLPTFEYDMALTYKENSVQFTGFLDSGNFLYTPISHRPVIIVAYESIKPLLTDAQIEVIEKSQHRVEDIVTHIDLDSVQVIPFSSVGCKEGVIWGMEVDQVTLKKGCFEKILGKCIVGVTFKTVFNGGVYKALLHPEFIISRGE